MRKVPLLFLGAALMAQAACAAGAETPTSMAPDVLVTDDDTLTRTHEASDLLIDRDNADTVYLSEVELQTGDCRFYLSTDRGTTWTAAETTIDSPLEEEAQADREPAPEASYTDCSLGPSGPQNVRTELAQAPDGTLYYAFHAHDPAAGGTRSILLARSRDDGRSWETTVVHAGPKATSKAEIENNFLPHLALDRDTPALIYIMWRRSFPRVEGAPNRPTRPWMAISDDGGASFGEPFMMFDHNIGFDAPRPIVVDGKLFAFYRVAAPSDGEDEPTRLFAGVSTDRGKTWEETEIASALDASEPIPLYDRERDVFHVVWHDNRNGDLDVFFSQSKDGREWSEPARLNDDSPENRVGQYYPQISLSPSGRIDVAWYDYRDDPNPPPAPEEDEPALDLGSNLGKIQSVYMTSSRDSGETWSENVRVNDVPIDRTIGTWNSQFFVVAPISVASWDDRVLVSWSDTRNGTGDSSTQDIYTSAVTMHGAGAGQVASAVLVVLAAALVGAGLALAIAVAVIRRSRRRPAGVA